MATVKDGAFNRILVTGSTGFLGHHLMPVLRDEFSEAEIIGVSRRDGDLREAGVAARLLAITRPDCVVHLAAKSGGILANQNQPADYFHDNLAINLHLFHETWRAGVRKLVLFMGGCSYPASARSPIGEDQMWNGYPQIESAGYSVAKKMLLTQSWAYRVQHGFNSIVLIPGNVYGEWDNFNLTESHVIPALIRKTVEARDRGDSSIVAIGTGRPVRDFVYAGDVAATVPWFVRHYCSSDPVNISTGTRTTVKDLFAAVCRATGFAGRVEWDPSQPDGQMERIYDVSRLRALGLSCNTPLAEGLHRTARWFVAARKAGTVRL